MEKQRRKRKQPRIRESCVPKRRTQNINRKDAAEVLLSLADLNHINPINQDQPIDHANLDSIQAVEAGIADNVDPSVISHSEDCNTQVRQI